MANRYIHQAPTIKAGTGKDPKQVFDAAEGYFQAGSVVVREIVAQRARGLLGFPYATLKSFSLELFLKCIAAIETGTPPRGHKLWMLFGRLSADSQAAIRERYDQVYYPMVEPKDDPPLGFDVNLSYADGVFERMRYPYEVIETRVWAGTLIRSCSRLDIVSATFARPGSLELDGPR